jgi:hypothetical protein
MPRLSSPARSPPDAPKLLRLRLLNPELMACEIDDAVDEDEDDEDEGDEVQEEKTEAVPQTACTRAASSQPGRLCACRMTRDSA